jgi:hypothetical protein
VQPQDEKNENLFWRDFCPKAKIVTKPENINLKPKVFLRNPSYSQEISPRCARRKDDGVLQGIPLYGTPPKLLNLLSGLVLISTSLSIISEGTIG